MTTTETPQSDAPVKKTRLQKIAGPALFTGCFVIWPAANVATAYFGWKSLDAKLALEKLNKVNDTVQS